MKTPRPPLVIAELSTARLVLRPLVHQYVCGSSPSHSIEQLRRRLAADLDQNGGMALPEDHRIVVSGATTPAKQGS